MALPKLSKKLRFLERGTLQPENLGLSLIEAKTLLQSVQNTLAQQQVAEYSRNRNSVRTVARNCYIRTSPQLFIGI